MNVRWITLAGFLAVMILLMVLSAGCFAVAADSSSVKPFPVPAWLEKDFRPAFTEYGTDELLNESVEAGITAIR